jgi:hypothetical protein
MTAPKPPGRVTMYKHAAGALHADCPHRTDPHVYIHEAAVEKLLDLSGYQDSWDKAQDALGAAVRTYALAKLDAKEG